MNHRFIFAAIALFAANCFAEQGSAPTVPATEVKMVVDTLHGVPIEDPYRWLEDQESPETRAWIKAENAYTDSMFALHSAGIDKLKEELARLRRVDSYGLPTIVNGNYYFSRRLADEELYSLCVRKGRNGKDSVLIAPTMLSPDNKVSLSTYKLSKDGSILYYGTRRGGEDEETWYFINMNTGAYLADTLPRARYYQVDLGPDNATLYYSRFDTNMTSHIMIHKMGAPFSNDARIFGEGLAKDQQAGGELAEDGKYLLIYVYRGSSTKKIELYAKNLAENGPVFPVVTTIEAQFSGTTIGDQLIVKTDWDAPNERVMSLDLRKPALENWKEIIPEQKYVLQSLLFAAGRMSLEYLHNVSSMVTMYDLSGKKLGDLIPDSTIGSFTGPNGRWTDKTIGYSFTSFNRPSTSFLYNVESGNREIWFQGPVAIDPEEVEVKQAWYPSKDGTQIPMFVVHKKGIQLDGNRPTIVYGYGGFSQSLTPYYSTTTAVWISRGGVYAVPSLRGGGEFGEDWHRAAILEKKQTTFDDFIAAADWLIANKYTNSSKLAIYGGSNGGLLVGACMTQRPDLYQAVICTYPLLDMLRFHKLLIGNFWISEYGSADSVNQFPFIREYSPYHNVKKGVDYPYTLFITGDADTRVAPAHARKMAALLQAESKGVRPIMLDYDVEAGHSGGEALTKSIANQARLLTFLFWSLGVS